MTPLLQVEDLHAGYGPTEILRQVSFEVGASDVMCIMGRNGAGKTTLLRALMGTLAKRGTVRFAGSDVSSWSGSRMHRAGVSWVPQEGSVFPGLTVREHLGIAGTRTTPERVIADAASLFPVLGERLEQEAQTLSGGERKMLGIALALASEPRLVLMDEPTEGVAPVVVQQLIPAIAAIRDRTAVVLVEQNVDTAVALGETAIVLEHGTVVERGTVAGLHEDGILERRLSL